MSSKLIQQLVSDEDEVLSAYQDHLGYWTIGVGRLIDKRRGGGISKEESRYLLQNDVAAKQAECHKAFPWYASLDPVRQDVITMMAFQLGTAGVKGFSKMCQAVASGDYARAAKEMLDSTWHKQTPARARRTAEMMRTGRWP